LFWIFVITVVAAEVLANSVYVSFNVSAVPTLPYRRITWYWIEEDIDAALSGRCAKVGALVHQEPPPSSECTSEDVGLAA
jgi:hypothetical protein